MTITNATSAKLAANLADTAPGFAGLIYTKQGTVKGGVRYEDDTVHDTINMQIHYAGDHGLKARDFDALGEITDAEILDEIKAKGLHGWAGRGDKATPVEITADHVKQARTKIEASTLKSMTGRNTSTTDHVFESLKVDGKIVRGARVYVCAGTDTCKCRNCNPDDARAPKPGTVYLTGLFVNRTVLEPAANGKAPAPKSNPVTVARRCFERRLPSRKFVSYRLEPGTDFILAIGGSMVDTKALAA